MGCRCDQVPQWRVDKYEGPELRPGEMATELLDGNGTWVIVNVKTGAVEVLNYWTGLRRDSATPGR